MTLARNASSSFLGAAVPSLLNIITVPYVLSRMGAADYGVLALVTSIVGYFSLIDINVTAGSTKFISEYRASGDKQRLNQTVCFGAAVYGVIGLIGCALLWNFAHTIVVNVFVIGAEHDVEAEKAIRIAAFGFAAGQLQAYLQSVPGALMRFDLAGRVEAAFGTLLPLLTIGLLYLGHGLVELVALRVLMSILQACVLLRLLFFLLPGFHWHWPDGGLRRALLSFSAYSFLARLATLTYAHADKLIISRWLGVAALAYFVVPSTLANRLMSLLGRLSGVMFPHASGLAAQHRIPQLQRDYLVASRYMLFLNGGLALLMATLSYPILYHWLTPEFARAGAMVMTLVALGQAVDSLTNLPSLVNDGLGHPRISGVFSVARAALSLFMIVLGVANFGIVGAAAAHLVASVLGSTVFLIFVHGRTVPVRIGRLIREAYWRPLCLLLPIALLGYQISEWAVHGWLHLMLALLLICSLLGISAYRFVLLPGHRLALCRKVAGAFP